MTWNMFGLGRRMFGVGIISLALVNLAWGDFDSGQPLPKAFPDRATLSYIVAACTLAAGFAMEWRRTAGWAAATLTAYYAFIVVLVMNGRIILSHAKEFGAYSATADELAIAAAGLAIYASNMNLEAARRVLLSRIAQITFGSCVILFGGAHFFYVQLTASLVPKWLPPSQLFWACITGAAQIAAGFAIVTGLCARKAAILLTFMYMSFTFLVHGPMLVARTSSHFIWTENATNLVLIGSAWVMTDLLFSQKPPGAHRWTRT